MKSLPKSKTLLCCIIACLFFSNSGAAQSSRREISLDGVWRLSANGSTCQAVVPGTFEQQIAPDFDGIGTYEREVDPIDIPSHHRLILRFAAVATVSTVWFNETRLGTHTGAWTPFKFDVTDLATAAARGPWKIRIQVDESVGHNTQGFLPIIQPHFGGVWQSARLEVVPEAWIDDDRLMAIGDWSSGKVSLSVPVNISNPSGKYHLEYAMAGRPRLAQAGAGDQVPSAETWLSLGQRELPQRVEQTPSGEPSQNTWKDGIFSGSIPTAFTKADAWTPANPQVFHLRIRIRGPATVDEVTVPVGFRSVEARDQKWFLNDQPLMIRGVLNWGYAPPLTSPSLDEAWMRNEIETAKSYGFNLMKFCLWVPPKRYLQLCDELGMLAWVEYPAWHPQMTAQHLDALRCEYEEFFAYDRNHPSVILRSLTCETGSGAELAVIQSLYDLCKRQIPGSIVEDDSSWIEWNRVSDFYDDHPYGNNHTWPQTLERLKKYIAEHEPKPLVLGEAIAADTWASPLKLAEWSKTAQPFHRPRFLDDNARWLNQTGLDDDQLAAASRRYAMQMRKYQIEAYRRFVPGGGYVVSVMRDFPLAGMGLVDYGGQEKWSRDDWSFHGETMLLLASQDDRRSFFADEPIRVPIAVSHFGSQAISDARLSVSLVVAKDGAFTEVARRNVEPLAIASGDCGTPIEISFDRVVIDEPTRLQVRADLTIAERKISNRWSIWVFPRQVAVCPLSVHPSLLVSTRQLEFAKLEAWAVRGSGTVGCAAKLDAELLDHVARGGRLLLVPNGERGSFPIEQHWFLRGGPAIFPNLGRVFGARRASILTEALVELQHFDLAGPVVPQVDSMMADIDPLVMLWDNHDRTETRTQGLLFEVPVGKGSIIVSVMDYARPTNAAGQWLLAEATKYLAGKEVKDADQRGDKNWKRLRAELERSELELHTRDWKFNPDAENTGEAKNWHGIDFDDSVWPAIKADRHWEGQGYESLDGWAWYRLRVPVDDRWAQAEKIYLNFTGVDDHYRLFINGQFVGSSGDIANKKTAFDERKSYEITSLVRGHDSIQIAIGVFDWYGAGGIFRPVTLSTQPLGDDRPWLK